jgi:hypothetical protein
MLGVQDAQEGVAEGPLGGAALTRYGDGLVGARGCLVLDEVLEVVIVYVIYRRRGLAVGVAWRWRQARRSTHSGPIRECSSGAECRRISYPVFGAEDSNGSVGLQSRAEGRGAG